MLVVAAVVFAALLLSESEFVELTPDAGEVLFVLVAASLVGVKAK